MNNQLAQLHYLDALAEELDMELLSLNSSSDMLTALELKFDKLSNIAAGIESYGMCRGDLTAIQELGYMRDKCEDAFTHARTNVGSLEVGNEAAALSGGLLGAVLAAIAALLAFIVGKFFKWALAGSSTSMSSGNTELAKTFADSAYAKRLKDAGNEKVYKKFLKAKECTRMELIPFPNLVSTASVFDDLVNDEGDNYDKDLAAFIANHNPKGKTESKNLADFWNKVGPLLKDGIVPGAYKSDPEEMADFLNDGDYHALSNNTLLAPAPDKPIDIDKEFADKKLTEKLKKLEKGFIKVSKSVTEAQNAGIADVKMVTRKHGTSPAVQLETLYLKVEMIRPLKVMSKLLSKVVIAHLKLLIESRLAIEGLLADHKAAVKALVSELASIPSTPEVADYLNPIKKELGSLSCSYDGLLLATKPPSSLKIVYAKQPKAVPAYVKFLSGKEGFSVIDGAKVRRSK